MRQYTYPESLAIEEVSTVEHEFLDGEIYALAGGTVLHAGLTVMVSSALQQQLRYGPYRVFSSDLRVSVLATGLPTYPDVTVVCGDLEMDPENVDTVTNPRVVVEVPSDSTEKFDRGLKLRQYQQIPTLGAVVLVAQRERRIEVVSQQPDGSWPTSVGGPGETAEIPPSTARSPSTTSTGKARAPAAASR